MTDWKLALNFGSFDGFREKISRDRIPITVWRPTFRQPINRGGRIVYVVEDPFELELVDKCSRICRYLFIQVRDPETTKKLPKLLPIAWVRFGGIIATVSQAEIDSLIAWTGELTRTAAIRLQGKAFADINRGRRVVVEQGVLQGLYGTIVDGGAQDKVIVEIEFLGQSTRCEVRSGEFDLIS